MKAEEVKIGRTDPLTRWKLVPVEPDNTMVDNGDYVIDWKTNPPASAKTIYSAMLSASPSPGEDVVERVAALLGKEIYCGQDESAPADNPCKKTWAAYKRRCPECALHPNERADLARAVLKALEG